jgi:bis(5'-nucleosidyl)-tetraphosphatase
MTLHEKSCGTVVFYCPHKQIKIDECEFLLLHYPEGHWDLPKGHVEKGEEELETALRELFEETGINKGEFLEGFKVKTHYFFRKKSELVSKTVMFFLYRAYNKEIKISFEHQNFIWLNYDEAIKKITFKNVREIVEEAKNHITSLDKKI